MSATPQLRDTTLLEVEAAGLAAERATPVAIEELSEALDAMHIAAERARANAAAEPLYQQADIDFHRAIIGAAANGRWRGWPSRSTER